MDKRSSICVTVLLQLLYFTKSELSTYCQQRCVPVDNCKPFKILPAAAQQEALMKYSCKNTHPTMYSDALSDGAKVTAQPLIHRVKFLCCPESNELVFLNSSGQNVMSSLLINSNVNMFRNKQPKVANMNNNTFLDPLGTNPSGFKQDDPEEVEKEIEGNKYPARRNYFENKISYKRDDNAAVAASKANHINIDNRISGGIPTELEDFPWTAMLRLKFKNGTRFNAIYCGGSLISKSFILTAAHCVKKNTKLINLKIHLAEYDTRTFPVDCKHGVDGKKCVKNIVMYAEKIIPHPKFIIKKDLQYDIAIIKLRGTANYTNFVRPIPLTPYNIDDPKFNSVPLVIAGWGRNGTFRTNVKQSAVVNLVPHSKCKSVNPRLTPTHLCAAGQSGEDACKGDSGGPLMMLYGGQYYLAGIISGKYGPCGTARPSLYTNVYNFLGWIKQIAHV